MSDVKDQGNMSCYRKKSIEVKKGHFETCAFTMEVPFNLKDGSVLETAGKLKSIEVALSKELDRWAEKYVSKTSGDFIKEGIPIKEVEEEPGEQWFDAIRNQILGANWMPWKSGKAGASAPVSELGTLNDYIIKNKFIGKNSFPFEGFRYWKFDVTDRYIQRGKM